MAKKNKSSASLGTAGNIVKKFGLYLGYMVGIAAGGIPGMAAAYFIHQGLNKSKDAYSKKGGGVMAALKALANRYIFLAVVMVNYATSLSMQTALSSTFSTMTGIPQAIFQAASGSMLPAISGFFSSTLPAAFAPGATLGGPTAFLGLSVGAVTGIGLAIIVVAALTLAVIGYRQRVKAKGRKSSSKKTSKKTVPGLSSSSPSLSSSSAVSPVASSHGASSGSSSPLSPASASSAAASSSSGSGSPDPAEVSLMSSSSPFSSSVEASAAPGFADAAAAAGAPSSSSSSSSSSSGAEPEAGRSAASASAFGAG